MKNKIAKFKIGDDVHGRIICEVIRYVNYNGKIKYRYGYKYKDEPKDIELLYCEENTLIKRFYKK